MNSEGDLMNILIDNIPYITYKDFIEGWVLEGSDELRYLSPYKSVPTWLIIDRTYHNYRDYCHNEQLIIVMTEIDEKVKDDNNIETRIRKRLFLFIYADDVMEGELACMCFPDSLWYYNHYDTELNKLKTKTKKLLIKKNIIKKNYSIDITETIKDNFILPSDHEVSDIIYLVSIISIISSHSKNKYEHPEVYGLFNMFPKLEIDSDLCEWALHCL